MITLWHSANARSFRPLWMLEELELPYQLHMVPFPPRVRVPDWEQINPLGTIPYFTDGDAVLTESSGILHYLAETKGRCANQPSPLAVRPHEKEYALYINYLFQSDATFTFPQTLVLRYRQMEPPERRLPQVADSYARWFLARMQWVEDHLADGRQWLIADRFTAADIAVGYACMLAEILKLSADLGPATMRWWAACQHREGFLRAKAAQNSGRQNG